MACIDKSKLLVLYKISIHNLYKYINNTLIEKVSSFKFLGLTTSDDIHIRKVTCKISISTGEICIRL